MKKLLLTFAVTVIATMSANAQCTPGANYADSTYGVWPDTIQNFPPATVNQAYSTDLNFKVPQNASDVDPTVSGTIQDFTVDNVTGLPPGMTYACDIASCTYPGGSNGCAQITGTCATAGTYDITVEVTGNVDIGFSIIVPVPQTFTGYRIEVGNTGVATLLAPKFEVYPNPAKSHITLNGLQDLNVTSLEVVSMSGAVLKSYTDIQSSAYAMNVEDLDNGMYFVRINHDGISELVKFVKK